MSQMSQRPCLCWRHVEEAKQIATKYSTDPKAPMNLGSNAGQEVVEVSTINVVSS